jgi:cytochrome c553
MKPRVKELSEQDVEALSAVSRADTEEAAVQWREDAPREARILLEAQEGEADA